MRKITDVSYTDAATSDYPDGRIRNKNAAALPAVIGTPIVEELYGDVLQFFHKLKRLAGITANTLPDNETNGYQTVDALESYVNSIGRYYEAHTVTGDGSETDNVTLAVTTKHANITKNDTDGQSVVTIPNVNKSSSFVKIKITNTGNENVLVRSNTGVTLYTAVANEENEKTDRIILIADKATNLWILVDALWSASDSDIKIGTNAYGYVSAKTMRVQPNWIALTLASGWGGNFYYRRNNIGQIEYKFNITGANLSGNIGTLPSGYRPEYAYKIYSNDSRGVFCETIINTDGTITTTYDPDGATLTGYGIHFVE